MTDFEQNDRRVKLAQRSQKDFTQNVDKAAKWVKFDEVKKKFDEVKKHSRTSPDVQFKEFSLTKQKLGLARANNGLGKPFRKNLIQKNRKNSKNQSEIAACEQKTTSEKANFCSNTIFSLYFKIRAKKFHAAKPLAFSLHFLFQRDQNHYSNLTSKIVKMCEQILKKKDSAPIQFKFFEL